MTKEEETSRKKQRSEYAQIHAGREVTMTDNLPPLNIQSRPSDTSTKGGPSGPSWSCRGCGRCNMHHTMAVPGCWACMQIMLNGPVFDAGEFFKHTIWYFSSCYQRIHYIWFEDRWGDFLICQEMKAARLTDTK